MATESPDPAHQQHDNRITALEETITHQARIIEELSVTVAEQWDELGKAKRKLDALTERFLTLEEATAPSPEITKPPHY